MRSFGWTSQSKNEMGTLVAQLELQKWIHSLNLLSSSKINRMYDCIQAVLEKEYQSNWPQFLYLCYL